MEKLKPSYVKKLNKIRSQDYIMVACNHKKPMMCLNCILEAYNAERRRTAREIKAALEKKSVGWAGTVREFYFKKREDSWNNFWKRWIK